MAGCGGVEDDDTTPDDGTTLDDDATPADDTAPDDDSTPDDDTSPHPGAERALWVWESDIPGDPLATADLLDFSASHGVGTLFLACDPVGYGIAGAEERYRSFVADAHAAGIRVFGMSGYPWFTVPCDAGLPGQDTCWTEGWGVYEACAASTAGFDGIMDDSEPASTPDGGFFDDLGRRGAWHVEYLRGIRERIGALPLHHAIPAWYDALEPLDLDGTGEVATLDAWIAGVVEVLGVMAYRDTAEAILPLVETEMSRAPVWIGLETGESSEGEDLTFYEEGAAALEEAMAALEAELADHPGLAGFMVHSYAGWRDL